jgi:hypothetical protein
MSDPVAEALRSLRRTYLDEAPARVGDCGGPRRRSAIWMRPRKRR